MIALKSVSKQFQHRGKPVAALANVSLEIAKGDFVAIIGPSGSGKSTFLHLLGGMLSPTEGKVRIGSDSLYDLSSDEALGAAEEENRVCLPDLQPGAVSDGAGERAGAAGAGGLAEDEQKRRAEALLGAGRVWPTDWTTSRAN